MELQRQTLSGPRQPGMVRHPLPALQGAGTRAAKASPSSATPARAPSECPRNSPPGASENTAPAAPRAPQVWPHRRAGSNLAQSRRNPPRSGSPEAGHRTHGPASAASPTSSPSSRPDAHPARSSPSPNLPKITTTGNQIDETASSRDFVNGLVGAILSLCAGGTQRYQSTDSARSGPFRRRGLRLLSRLHCKPLSDGRAR